VDKYEYYAWEVTDGVGKYWCGHQVEEKGREKPEMK
jgi:hypothetical protein